MTLEDAMPLVSALGQILAHLISEIMQSKDMSDEQKKAALVLITAQYDATAEKVAGLKF